MPGQVHKDPADCNEVAANATVGGLYEWKADLYKYYKFVNAVTYAIGHVLEYGSTDGKDVTNDKSGGASLGKKCAGITMDVMTQDYHGYARVSGVVNVLGDGSVAAGEFVVSDSADGKADTMADGEEEQVFGMALEDDDATTVLFACALQGIV